MDNEREYIWIDIEVTMQDLTHALRTAGDDDTRAMLDALPEHLQALRALERQGVADAG